jgi:hypothetical protein
MLLCYVQSSAVYAEKSESESTTVTPAAAAAVAVAASATATGTSTVNAPTVAGYGLSGEIVNQCDIQCSGNRECVWCKSTCLAEYVIAKSLCLVCAFFLAFFSPPCFCVFRL